MARRLAAAALVLTLAACARVPQNVPAATASAKSISPSGAMFAGRPPARMHVTATPLDVDPSGAARLLVRVTFVDAAGRDTELMSGGDVEFVPSRGTVQWQTRLRFDGPAAIVSTVDDGPLAVRVRAAVGTPVRDVRVATDTRAWRVSRVIGRALGPHSVWLGWFPVATEGPMTIARAASREPLHLLATLAAPSSTYRDDTVVPGETYRYLLSFSNGKRVTLRANVPSESRHGTLAAFGGKSMWLSFSPSRLDADSYERLDPPAVIAKATSAGLRSLDLRTTYGPFRELAGDDEPTIDALIDGLTANGIAPIAWTVPRSTSFEDLEAEVAAAGYRTPNGNGFAALDVDLERGDYFLGTGSAGYRALATYLRLLRAALGPRYPILATVEDPYLEHLSNADVPYAAIATQAGAIGPMTYWRMLSPRVNSPSDVRSALAGSYAATLALSMRKIPINLGLQSSAGGPRGAPPPNEISSAIAQARTLGASGVTLFDWSGTSTRAWTAIGATDW